MFGHHRPSWYLLSAHTSLESTVTRLDRGVSRLPPFWGGPQRVQRARIGRGSVPRAPVPYNGGPNGCMCSSMTLPVGLEATKPYADAITASCMQHRQNGAKWPPSWHLPLAGHPGQTASHLL